MIRNARRNWRSRLRWKHYSNGVSFLLAGDSLLGGCTLRDGRWNNWTIGCPASGQEILRGMAMRKLRRRIGRLVDACLGERDGK